MNEDDSYDNFKKVYGIGIEKAKIEVVLKSLKLLDDKSISAITGISIEEIKKIRNENKGELYD